MKKGEKTTYALLAAAQEREKGHDMFETGIFTVFILITVLAMWQFAEVGKHRPRAARASLHHHVHKAHFATDSRPG